MASNTRSPLRLGRGTGWGRLAKHNEALDHDAQLAAARAEQLALDAEKVAEVEELRRLPCVLAQSIAAEEELKARAVFQQVEEDGAAHATARNGAPGDANPRRRRGLLLAQGASAGERMARRERRRGIGVGPFPDQFRPLAQAFGDEVVGVVEHADSLPRVQGRGPKLGLPGVRSGAAMLANSHNKGRVSRGSMISSTP